LAKGIKTIWFNGLTDEEKKLFEQTLRGNKLLVRQLLRILKSRYESVERKGLSEDDYKNCDWVHLQAFNNGRLKELTEIADLFNFEGE
jgi:hypothetical protein